MAGGKLSPRQRMINMMYLVLTALLALNVSKEVLNSFFEVNQSIERTTSNSVMKNAESYTAIKQAGEQNRPRYGKVADQAAKVKKQAQILVDSLQSMKYRLVLAADKRVYLSKDENGKNRSVRDEDGQLIEDLALTKSWKELPRRQQNSPIATLERKSDRYKSSELFYKTKDGAEFSSATMLKDNMIDFKKMLLAYTKGNKRLTNFINETFRFDPVIKKDGDPEAWEKYNFNDMPAVGALTLLSKMQADIRTAETYIVEYMKKQVDAKLIKVGDVRAVQIPNSTNITQGGSFSSEIFVAAQQDNGDQEPNIYVGAYDSTKIQLVLDGKLKTKDIMLGEYETLDPIGGKAQYVVDAKRVGPKKWGGLIEMQTETETKVLPFSGEYLVAPKTAIVSPSKMNILYRDLEEVTSKVQGISVKGNPIEVSVPGYPASAITARGSGVTLRIANKSKGLYSAFPKKGVRLAKVSLYVDIDGKSTKMGETEFRVKSTPDPTPSVTGVKDGFIPRSQLKNSLVTANLKDFLFDGLKYTVQSFKFECTVNGVPTPPLESNDLTFTRKMKSYIADADENQPIIISNIKVKIIGGAETKLLPSSVVFKVK